MNLLILDVVIPTSSADKQNIILKEGQKVMVLKSPKGIYMQLETGKIIAIRTALKVGHNKDKSTQETTFMAREMQKRNPISNPSKSPVSSTALAQGINTTETANFSTNSKSNPLTPSRPRGVNHVQFGRNNSVSTNKNVQMGTAKPYNLKSNAPNAPPTLDESSMLRDGQYSMSNSNSSFDADISDDSQFLEKLRENIANQQSSEDDVKKSTKKENKTSEHSTQNISNEQQPSLEPQKNQSLQLHDDKSNNGNSIVTNEMQMKLQSHAQNKPEQMSLSYGNNSTDNYDNINNGNGSNANYAAHQNYNYNYNSTSNVNYNGSQPGQVSKHPMQSSNMMNPQQPEKYQATVQHVC